MLICATVALLYGTMAEESGMRVNCQLFVAVYVCGGWGRETWNGAKV